MIMYYLTMFLLCALQIIMMIKGFQTIIEKNKIIENQEKELKVIAKKIYDSLAQSQEITDTCLLDDVQNVLDERIFACFYKAMGKIELSTQILDYMMRNEKKDV